MSRADHLREIDYDRYPCLTIVCHHLSTNTCWTCGYRQENLPPNQNVELVVVAMDKPGLGEAHDNVHKGAVQ
jgi:hypothetical protein